MARKSRFFTVAAATITLLALVVWLSCEKGPQSIVDPGQIELNLAKASSDLNRVMDIQDRHTQRFLTVEGVVGTATALNEDGGYAIKIMVRDEVSTAEIPAQLEGVPVVVSVVGHIRAEDAYTDRYRPVSCGVSGGSFEYYRSNQMGYVYDGGTIGCVVKKGSDRFFLSNNHVFAHANRRAIGDGIVQPALIDVGGVQNPDDIVAELYAFKTIFWKPLKNSNIIDAAIAKIKPGIEFTGVMIAGYAPATSPAEATLGMAVKKCGRTTGLTFGTVTGVNVTIVVDYMPAGYARFENQIEYTKMTDSGDSGSLIVTESGNQPVALHFAGGSTAGYGNPIQPILDYFGVTIYTN